MTKNMYILNATKISFVNKMAMLRIPICRFKEDFTTVNIANIEAREIFFIIRTHVRERERKKIK